VFLVKIFFCFRCVATFAETGITVAQVGLAAIPAKGASERSPVAGSGLVRAGHGEHSVIVTSGLPSGMSSS